MSVFNQLPANEQRQFLVTAAKAGAESAGYKLTRVPGRGLSNVWMMEKDGKVQKAAIRTTRDRWIAFPPMEGGKKWKTLDDVEMVVIATIDSKDDPKKVEVYLVPASVVRQHFDASYEAHAKAKHALPDEYGLWVGLEVDNRGLVASAGSGIISKYPPVSIYPLEGPTRMATAELTSEDITATNEDATQQETRPETIADVMAWARQRVAAIAGVRLDAVKLDIKLEY